MKTRTHFSGDLSIPTQPQKASKLWLHIFLFLVTVITTVGVGGSGIGSIPYAKPFNLGNGIAFSATLLLILGVHELGHYYMARRWFMRVSFPYFIPIPIGLGTLGAFIRLRSPMPNRRVLLDIGVAGPLAGFVIAIPALIVGIHLSNVMPMGKVSEGIILGEPLLFSFLLEWILGISADDYSIVLHPIALGGWLGLFITALNLLPIGQLDGGHIVYALLGRRHGPIAFITLAVLLFLAFFWIGWIVWCVFPFAVGFIHPPTLDDMIPLGRIRKLICLLCAVVLVLSFTPEPFRVF